MALWRRSSSWLTSCSRAPAGIVGGNEAKVSPEVALEDAPDRRQEERWSRLDDSDVSPKAVKEHVVGLPKAVKEDASSLNKAVFAVTMVPVFALFHRETWAFFPNFA
ncbi:hypothetical protein ZWY2020_045517 [Hordeum vulgare]|nr:hypothetical protein ZWY2020_045517 [Hordeum vulgare]